ncbi:hypothetical protein ACLEIY_15985 [Acetobacter tropicalis]|uniref:hypothetical protein n=1 Tax=Acetobacter tropicalis TaxID=104102 RepID=UPI0039763F2C
MNTQVEQTAAPSPYVKNAAANPEVRKIVDAALKPYGAHLTNDGRIQKGSNGPSGIFVTASKGRVRFRYENGALAASGPLEEKTISKFVEEYWFWAPNKGRKK